MVSEVNDLLRADDEKNWAWSSGCTIHCPDTRTVCLAPGVPRSGVMTPIGWHIDRNGARPPAGNRTAQQTFQVVFGVAFPQAPDPSSTWCPLQSRSHPSGAGTCARMKSLLTMPEAPSCMYSTPLARELADPQLNRMRNCSCPSLGSHLLSSSGVQERRRDFYGCHRNRAFSIDEQARQFGVPRRRSPIGAPSRATASCVRLILLAPRHSLQLQPS